MSAPIIILSSSPLPAFAPSPTPAKSSPLFPSTQEHVRSSPAQSPSRSRSQASPTKDRDWFQDAPVSRKGFAPGFQTAREVLGIKKGAANAQIVSPRRNLSRNASVCKTIEVSDRESSRKETDEEWAALSRNHKQGVTAQISKRPVLVPNNLELESYAALNDRRKDLSPLVRSRYAFGDDGFGARHGLNNERGFVAGQLESTEAGKLPSETGIGSERATAQRDGRTPTDTNEFLSRTEEPRAAIMSFPECFNPSGHDGSRAGTVICKCPADDGGLTKRRKVEISNPVQNSAQKLSTTKDSKPKPETAARPKTVSKQSRSSTKKSLTITGLATSRYSAPDEEKQTPMMQFLTSTQARVLDDGLDEPTVKVKPKKVRRAPKAKQKSRLASPQSALRTIESQELIFASASQLAKEDSPTFLRDTIEAIHQSELQFDLPPSPTQETMPISIESTTPRVGTSRFQRRRNLWSAADRDEGYALVYDDDTFDTPIPKEISEEQNYIPRMDLERQSAAERPLTVGSNAMLLGPRPKTSIYDVDTVLSARVVGSGGASPMVSARFLCTSTSAGETGSSTEKKQSVIEGRGEKHAELHLEDTETSKQKPRPNRPRYQGFSDHDLKKQITAYGFKPIKKREKMIALLDKCWTDQHGPSVQEGEAPVEPEAVIDSETLGHGHFLSKVHGIADRPVPKVKKTRARQPKKDAAPKEPKKRKAAQPNVKEPKPKTPRAKKTPVERTPRATAKSSEPGEKKARKRKPAIALSEEVVFDVEDSVAEAEPAPQMQAKPDSRADVRSDEVREKAVAALPGAEAASEAKPKSKPKPKSQTRSKSRPKLQVSAPRKTHAEGDGVCSKDIHEVPESSATPSLPDISNQVAKAITFESHLARLDNNPRSPRSHQSNPTWHEKILLYDPIVLEDLTLWLNTEGFTRIGEDREIDAIQVKAWCEEHGVCCLWKGGWRGNKKAKGSKEGEDS